MCGSTRMHAHACTCLALRKCLAPCTCKRMGQERMHVVQCEYHLVQCAYIHTLHRCRCADVRASKRLWTCVRGGGRGVERGEARGAP